MQRVGITIQRICLGILFFLPVASRTETLPSGSGLELRMLRPVGSRISHPGDLIEAVVIAPATNNGEVVVPPGATLSGRVTSVGRLGLGLKRARATIELDFDTLHLPDGPDLSVQTRLAAVETAKERVSEGGMVGGIRPSANLSATVLYYALPILCMDPAFGVPVLAVKALIARSPDSEIYFPRGTELVLRLDHPIEVAATEKKSASTDIQPLSASDLASSRALLEQLPTHQAERGPNRPSDLLNILFLGTADQLNRAFHAAGWSGAQERSLLTIFRMYHCMVQRTAYTAAPMGKLKFNGLTADADYQKSLNTFSKRHHLRLWHQPQSDAWLSAATEDISYRFHRGHLTHASDSHIDDERAKVLNDLAFTGCLESAALVSRDWEIRPVPDSAAIQTDGKVAVLKLNDCFHPRAMPVPLPNSGGQPGRLLQMAEAIRTDLVRSNPISLAANTRTMVEKTPSHELNSFRLKRATTNQARIAGSQTTEQKADARNALRSSVLDTSDGRDQ